MFGHRVFLRLGELPDVSLMQLYKDTYELLSCEYSFEQGIDEKGQAQTDVRGGRFDISISNLPPKFILKWALDSRKYVNGVIVTCDADNLPLEKIYFEDAACVSMDVEYTQAGEGYATTKLIFMAREVKVGSNKLENKWEL